MNLRELGEMYNLAGKTVVITGGAGILGGEIACGLVGCNANVAIMDRDPALADRLMSRLQSDVGRAIVVYADVLNTETLQKAAETIDREFGHVDFLINAAGGNHPKASTSPEMSFFDIPQDALRWVFDLNIIGTMLPCQVFGKRMAERGEGGIVNISSMNAFRPLTRIAAYSAAKAGVSNFTEWLAVHMAQEYSAKIRVNAIAPGFIDVGMSKGMPEEVTQNFIKQIPLGRLGEAHEIVDAALFLASPMATYITGHVLMVNGGFYLG